MQDGVISLGLIFHMSIWDTDNRSPLAEKGNGWTFLSVTFNKAQSDCGTAGGASWQQDAASHTVKSCPQRLLLPKGRWLVRSFSDFEMGYCNFKLEIMIIQMLYTTSICKQWLLLIIMMTTTNSLVFILNLDYSFLYILAAHKPHFKGADATHFIWPHWYFTF